MVDELINKIIPLDEIEAYHIQDTLAWVQSGAPLYRTHALDVPNKHLASYFVLIDMQAQKVLLVDHKRAKRWLPAGGHVEIEEHPKQAAIRECAEELGITAEFLCEEPFFLTQTQINGINSEHMDVSFWYVMKGDHQAHYDFDTTEFEDICWFDFDAIPFENSDPNMQRFMQKWLCFSAEKKGARQLSDSLLSR